MKQIGSPGSSPNAPSSTSSQATPPTAGAPAVQFDVSNLQSSYANVCNVSSTREEVVLAFGVNNVWERGQENIQVQMTNRIVLNPYAAKRLSAVLARVVTEYEARFGTLDQDTKSRPNAA